MTAEIVGTATRFIVAPAPREDGTIGPPDWVTLSLRPCWRKPPVKVDLELVYEVENVAYYQVAKRS